VLQSATNGTRLDTLISESKDCEYTLSQHHCVNSVASSLHLPSKFVTRSCRDRDFLVRLMRLRTDWCGKLSQADMNSHSPEYPTTYHSTTSIPFISRRNPPIRRRATTTRYWMWNINNWPPLERVDPLHNRSLPHILSLVVLHLRSPLPITHYLRYGRSCIYKNAAIFPFDSTLGHWACSGRATCSRARQILHTKQQISLAIDRSRFSSVSTPATLVLAPRHAQSVGQPHRSRHSILRLRVDKDNGPPQPKYFHR
jgi:hypothetical protein